MLWSRMVGRCFRLLIVVSKVFGLAESRDKPTEEVLSVGDALARQLHEVSKFHTFGIQFFGLFQLFSLLRISPCHHIYATPSTWATTGKGTHFGFWVLLDFSDYSLTLATPLFCISATLFANQIFLPLNVVILLASLSYIYFLFLIVSVQFE